MNAARLARRWQEAAGDPARMAEALVDEIDDPATGLVSRDFLRAELTQVRQEIATLGGDLRQEMASLRGDLRHEMATLAGELRQEMASLDSGLRQEMAQIEGRLTWRIVTLLGVQIALVGILVTILIHVLR
jgi:hypothetical protein